MRRVLQVDEALCPSTGEAHLRRRYLDFEAEAVEAALARMESVAPADIVGGEIREVPVEIPGGVGDIMMDPDGGAWVRGKFAVGGRGSEVGDQGR